MKLKSFIILYTLMSSCIYAQTHKLLRGKVMSDHFVLENVDVINKNTANTTKTNNQGEFIIAASVNDSILFFDKDYHLKGIKLNPEDLETNNMIVSIDRKPEELKEIVIRKVSVDWEFDKKWEQLKRDEIAVYRQSKQLKNPGVYDGTITNGMDFVKIGKLLFGDKLKRKKNAVSNVEFKDVATANFDEKFFTETLQLKKEEIETFLTFCNFDPESKKIQADKNSNSLVLMDYLYQKSFEYKKANAPE